MTRSALFAIVTSRLRAARRPVVYSCAAAALGGAMQLPYLEGPVLFCSLIGMLLALLQGPGRYPHLDLCEQGAPLFGRELARARAIAPCIAAGLATAAYSIASLAHTDLASAAYAFVAALGAVISCTLVALCASIRTGAPRWLYLALGCASGIVALELAASLPIAAELGFCALVAFTALRQYGEALARYDPV